MSIGDFVPLQIAKKAKKAGMKFLMEGQGADELFLGYSRFKEINPNMNLNEIISVLSNTNFDLLKRIFKLEINQSELNNLYSKYFVKGKTNIERAQLFYLRNFLQELLRIEDHVHMYNNIENIVPFLSLDILNWINKNELVINEKSNKNAEYNVHVKINTILTERKTKENLNGSLNQELLVNRKKFSELLNKKKIFDEFDYELVNYLLKKDRIMELNKNEAFLLWHIYNLCIWYSKNKFSEKICLKNIVEEMLE